MDSSLYSVLRHHHKTVKRNLSRHKKAYEWLFNKGLSAKELREKSTKLIAAGALSASLLLSPGSTLPRLATELVGSVFAQQITGESVRVSFAAALAPLLPQNPQALDPIREEELTSAFKKYLGVDAVATLEGNHLPTTYGYTGAEQHLARFPGDSIYEHNEEQAQGMAPGLGAWGYFAPSKDALTAQMVVMEKYYVAVQTFNIPTWKSHQPYLKDWYKFRKVLVVNPKNGQAAIAVVGDAGPADWTGKQFGSSPELMHNLKLDVGMKKGEVIILFVNDPENKIPLGPINYDNIKLTI